MQSDVELFGTEKVDMKYCDIHPRFVVQTLFGAWRRREEIKENNKSQDPPMEAVKKQSIDLCLASSSKTLLQFYVYVRLGVRGGWGEEVRCGAC